MLEDKEGNFWLGSYDGLYKYDPDSMFTIIYDEYDGLADKEFMSDSKLESASGEFYFGGVKGLTRFTPGSILNDTIVPDVILSEFQLFHKKQEIATNGLLKQHINYTKKLVLKPKQNVLSFEFAALDYQSPQKNQYAYKMEGVDPEKRGGHTGIQTGGRK